MPIMPVKRHRDKDSGPKNTLLHRFTKNFNKNTPQGFFGTIRKFADNFPVPDRSEFGLGRAQSERIRFVTSREYSLSNMLTSVPSQMPLPSSTWLAPSSSSL
jgi:hypothetical protein